MRNDRHHMDSDVKTFCKAATWIGALVATGVVGIYGMVEYDDYLTNQHNQQFIIQCEKLNGAAEIHQDNQECISGNRILISNNQNANN